MSRFRLARERVADAFGTRASRIDVAHRKSHRKAHRKLSNRRGAILIAAIAAFAIFSMLAAVAVSVTLRARQSCKTERDLMQLELLCDAGLMRATQKLAVDSGYTGEDWLEMPLGDSGKTMRVSIQVSEPKISASTEMKDGDEWSKVIEVRSQISGRSRVPISMQRTRTTKYSTKQL